MARLERASHETGLQIMNSCKVPIRFIYAEFAGQARLLKTLLSNCSFDRGSLSPTYNKPFDVFANGGKTGDWLAALDDFRNWLIREAA
jgi:hypothetical protein